jgi:hypothetical protein
MAKEKEQKIYFENDAEMICEPYRVYLFELPVGSGLLQLPKIKSYGISRQPAADRAKTPRVINRMTNCSN